MCALIAACSGEEEHQPGFSFFPSIAFPVMFSAFGGSHDYAVTPSVPAAGDNELVVASSLVWNVDERFARIEPFDGLPAAIQATTRGSGSTAIEVRGEDRGGGTFRSRAHLTITKASDEDWNRGEARYHNGPRTSLTTLLASIDDIGGDAGVGDCSDLTTSPSFPATDAACVSCHDDTRPDDTVLITPTQLAGYSNEDLIATITQARKQPGFVYKIWRDVPRPDCIFAKFHSCSVDEQDQLGLVLKLRSLTPQVVRKSEP